MKRPYHLNTSFPFGKAVLAMSVVAVSLVACSSDDSSEPAATTSTKQPNDPANPPATPAGPTESTPDAGTTTDTPAGDCKTAPPSDVCGVSPQCGCAPNQTCDVLDSTGTARCIKSGDAPMGYPCVETAECATGMTCIFNICHAFCDDPSSACSQPGTGACAQITTQDGVPIPNLAICRVACELHDPMSCGGTTSSGTGVCKVDDKGQTECQEGGTLAEGATCTPPGECGPGLSCVSSGSTSTCKRWCRVGEKDCGAGKACRGFAKDLNVRGVSYGACG